MHNNHIQYIELYATDLEATKKFYSTVFGWTFTDYGEKYTAFGNAGVEGGFEKIEKHEQSQNGALVILYHSNLEKAKETVLENGGSLAKDIFAFPGGTRFHFTDPSGNELAVWSDK